MHNYADANSYFPVGSQDLTLQGLFTWLLPFIEQQNVFDSMNTTISGQGVPQRYTPIPTYVCPSYPFRTVETNNPTAEMNGALATYQGIAGWIAGKGEKITTSSYGDMPDNGIFGWKFNRRLNEVTDGLSNTLAIGEYVHFDKKGDAYSLPPGNIRGWIMGDNGQLASYVFRVTEYPLNSKLDRNNDGIPFNHLPLGSYHPNGANFAIADGSVRFIANVIDMTTYQSLSTVSNGEPVILP